MKRTTEEQQRKYYPASGLVPLFTILVRIFSAHESSQSPSANNKLVRLEPRRILFVLSKDIRTTTYKKNMTNNQLITRLQANDDSKLYFLVMQCRAAQPAGFFRCIKHLNIKQTYMTSDHNPGAFHLYLVVQTKRENT